MTSDNLVTVCIATYNRMHLLPKTVRSVLNQTYQNIELIIVNDNSPDDTERVVAALMRTDHRISTIKHETNKGLAAARNTAIAHAKGKYFTFIDDDDCWAENYIEEFVKVAEQYDENWCFCCGSVTVDNIGRHTYGKFPDLDGQLLKYIKLGYTPPVASQFYSTNLLKQVKGYNESITSGVDHDLWLTLALEGAYIKSLSQYLSCPGNTHEIKRQKMTNTYHKRIDGITKSLQIWKDPIVEHLGIAFFENFCSSYLIREKKKFFRLFLMKFELINAWKVYLEIHSDLKTKEIVNNILMALLVVTNTRIESARYTVKRPALSFDKQ